MEFFYVSATQTFTFFLSEATSKPTNSVNKWFKIDNGAIKHELKEPTSVMKVHAHFENMCGIANAMGSKVGMDSIIHTWPST